MSAVQPKQFSEFFHAIHGYDPFPWQRRLAERVALGDWPGALALPTASGKTACIDAAIFAMAVQADLPPERRTAARRIVFVVDRRIVVDQAHERALKIANKLRESSSGVLAQAAAALRDLGGLEMDDDPLACFLLRGGIYRDQAWAKSPTQATVIASTVDQVGSRLLFRGYGVSDSLRPIHAGLVGNDALIILDEAHCAVPFSQTVAAVQGYRTWADGDAVSPPFRLVVLSATPPPELAGDVSTLDSEDRENDRLRKRLRTPKPTELVSVTVPGGKAGAKRFAESLVKEAKAMVDSHGRRSVAIMVNRVATARHCYDFCRQAWRDGTADILLMTGRMRPLDRDKLLNTWKGQLGSTETPLALDRPLIVVATQCLEVGADWDFDALVTECASFDSLRQRFGRLDRLGVRTGARGVIAIRAGDIRAESAIEGADDLDFIYGASLHRTWNWLWGRPNESGSAERPVVDFGIDAVDGLLPADPPERTALLEYLQLKAPNAPILLPAYLDFWAQTAPRPDPDPIVAPFLHGVDQGQPEVQVCWRSDLTIPEGVEWDRDEVSDRWIETVALCPPASPECMPVPLGLFRHWMSKGEKLKDDGGDLEQTPDDSEPTTPPDATLRPVLRWVGPESNRTELILDPERVRPGDTLVIPASLRGWDVLGHIPDAPEGSEPLRPIDLAEKVNRVVRRKALLRLHESLLAACPGSTALGNLKTLWEGDAELATIREEIRESLRNLAKEQPEGPAWFKDFAQRALELSGDPRFLIKRHPDEGLVLVGSRRLSQLGHDYDAETETTEDDTASATVRVALESHQDGVRKYAERYARHCGLPVTIREALDIAARMHDLGKLDLRFQAWLHGGNTLAASLAPRPLAKSWGLPLGRAERARARERAGYPRNGRHELLSVTLAEKLLDQSTPNRDLVLHLIGSHHGHARPLAPYIEDHAPIEVRASSDGQHVSTSSDTGLHRFDSGVPERFWTLVRRHGWWGLAWLEAILRLADHRQSALEQTLEETNDEP